MFNQKESPVGWGFWFLWVLATAVSWGVSVFVGFFILFFQALGRTAPASGVSPVVIWLEGTALGTGIGAVIGTFQWLVLRRHIPQSGWWVLASAVGWGAGSIVLRVVSEVTGEHMPEFLGLPQFEEVSGVMIVVAGAVAGVMIGIMQWFILRRHISQSDWWVLASALAYAGASVGVRAVGSVALGGVIVAVVTGTAMAWLLRQLRPEAQIDVAHAPSDD